MISTYISQSELTNRVKDLGAEISDGSNGEPIHIICVLSGAYMFCADLVRSIEVPVHMDFIDASSIRGGIKSAENFHINYSLQNSIEGKNVVLLEDIVDTGITLTALMKFLKTKKPKSIKICTLLYKPMCAKHDEPIDYYGFEIENKYVVGYGMDYKGEFRALPYIATLDLPPNSP